MTDYFTRLIERARGSEPVVQPRLESWFAPGADIAPEPPAAAAPSLTRPVEPTAAESTPLRAPNVSRQPEARPQASQVEWMAPREPRIEAREPEPMTVPVSKSRIEVPFMPLAASESTAFEHQPEVEHVRPRAALRVSLEVAAPPAHTAPVEPGAVPARASEEQRSSRALAATPPAQPARSEAVVERPAGQRLEPRSQPAPEAGPPRRAAPHALPVAARTRTPNIETPAAEPSRINVTIGRIEVRAVSPPAPPPAPRQPAGPKISLEEYLRSFQGERR